MRGVALVLLALLGACAPGQLDPTKVNAVNSCVQLMFIGSPTGGNPTTDLKIPLGPAGVAGGFGATADVTPPYAQTCTVTGTSKDDHTMAHP